MAKQPAEQPMMTLRGSRLRTNEFRPNVVHIFQNRIEDHDPGVLKRSSQTIRMDHIAQVREDRGIAYSTLIIESTGGGTIHARGLSKADASNAKEMIDDLAHQARHPQHAAPAAPHPPAAAPPAPTTVDQLGQLVAMKEAGHLTDEEFAAQKAAVLGVPATPPPPPPPGGSTF